MWCNFPLGKRIPALIKKASAAYLMQRYAFLLKDARNYWKMFEGEGDKNKKGVSRLPDMLGKKDPPFIL